MVRKRKTFSQVSFLWRTDAQMKVSVQILQRVYDAFQGGDGKSQGENDFLDPDEHLRIVDAHDMPLWNWSNEKGAFEKSARLFYALCSRSNMLFLQSVHCVDYVGLSRVSNSRHAQQTQYHKTNGHAQRSFLSEYTPISW